MKNIYLLSGAIFIAFFTLINPALAHTAGHIDGLYTGFSHPIFGLDHLLAMLSVGTWGAFQFLSGDGELYNNANAPDKYIAKRAWLAPVIFMIFLTIGGGFGLYGMTTPFIEPGILASVVFLGLMIACVKYLRATIGLFAIAIFALLHGQAHGLEVSGSFSSYVLGFLTSTLAIHIIGYFIGKKLANVKYGAPVIGGSIAISGLAIMLG